MSYSLFVNLTEPTAESYPATNVSKYLIELIGKDVCAFRRNTQVSYRVVEQARAISRTINELIKRVDENDDWDAFDKYTQAIDPLEDSLFPLVDTAEKERDQYLAQQDSVDACISFIEAWVTRRQDIRDRLKILRTKDEFKKLLGDAFEPEEDVKAAYQYDDMKFLAELVKAVERYEPRKFGIRSRTVDYLIRDVIKEVKAIEARLVSAYSQTEDASFVWSIRGAMIIYGAMELILNTKIDGAWIAHAKSEVIWKAAQGLVKLIRAHLEQTGDTKPSVAELKTKYDEFLTLLRGSMAVKLPANFIQLMKHAGRIGRAYHSQALYLVSLCRELAKHFESPVNQTAQNLEPLKEAIDETIKALEAARQQDVSFTKFDLAGFDAHAVTTGFATARDDIKHCYEKFGLTSAWDERATKLTASIANDKARMEQMNKNFEKATVPVDKTSLVNVVLKVYRGKAEGSVLHTLTYSLRPDTRLTAIQWQASKEQYQDSSLAKQIVASTTYLAKATQKLDSSVDIGSLTTAGSPCELALVVA